MPKREKVRKVEVHATVNMTQGRTPYEVNELHVQGMGYRVCVYSVEGPGIVRRTSGYHEIAELQALLNIAYAEGAKSAKRSKKR
jgi:hypothetical protein